MDTPISRSLVELALALAAADPAHEVCGLLLGVAGRVTALRPAGNVAADPAHSFEVDPAILIAAHRAARAGGPAVLGCYHSHPDGSASPSARDAAAASADQLWLILAGATAALFRFRSNGFTRIPLDRPQSPPCLAVKARS